MARGFEQLLNYEGDDVEDVFCLNFVGSYEAYGEVVEKPLVRNGKDIPVTSQNKREYVERYASFVMNTSIAEVSCLSLHLGPGVGCLGWQVEFQ